MQMFLPSGIPILGHGGRIQHDSVAGTSEPVCWEVLAPGDLSGKSSVLGDAQ